MGDKLRKLLLDGSKRKHFSCFFLFLVLTLIQIFVVAHIKPQRIIIRCFVAAAMILEVLNGDQIGFILPFDGGNRNILPVINRKISAIDLNIHSICIYNLNVATFFNFLRRNAARIHHFKGYGFGYCLIFQFSVLKF